MSPGTLLLPKTGFVLGTPSLHPGAASGFHGGFEFCPRKCLSLSISTPNPSCLMFARSVGCQPCGLGGPGWCSTSGGFWSLTSCVSKSLPGTCRLWLVHSSEWPPGSIITVPVAPLPCPGLAGPASGGARRQGRGISSGFCYVTRLCLLAAGAAARRGAVCAHTSFRSAPRSPELTAPRTPAVGTAHVGAARAG